MLTAALAVGAALALTGAIVSSGLDMDVTATPPPFGGGELETGPGPGGDPPAVDAENEGGSVTVRIEVAGSTVEGQTFATTSVRKPAEVTNPSGGPPRGPTGGVRHFRASSFVKTPVR